MPELDRFLWKKDHDAGNCAETAIEGGYGECPFCHNHCDWGAASFGRNCNTRAEPGKRFCAAHLEELQRATSRS